MANRCPNCGKFLSAKDKKCSNCGAKQALGSSGKYCDYCGSRMKGENQCSMAEK